MGRDLRIYTELKRRNVFKVAIVYSAVAWLLLQVSDTLGPALHLPEWFVSAVAFLLILGFPVAIIFAWAFELTSEGLKRETDASPAASTAGNTSKKLNHTILAALVLALGYFVFDKFVLDPGRDATGIATAVQVSQQQAAELESEKTDKSIAVLPFVNMSSDEEQEYFSDGLSEELLNLLAKIPELRVAARTSSFSFKGKNLEVPEIASRLKVAHVLEGSVRKDGKQIRITAQLIQADNGYHLWSETYDRQLDNIFQVQEDIAAAVVDALKITLLGEAPKVRITDPAAYQLFLQGQYLKRRITAESSLKAIDAFKKAVEIDPSYAPAWAELADAYIWLGGDSREISRSEGADLADPAIQKAIGADPDYGYAYYVRGIAWMFTKYKFNKGIEDFQYALKLEPDNAFVVAGTGKGALLTGKFDYAISQFQAALIMEPVVPEFYWYLGKVYRRLGRLDDAEDSFRKMDDLSPSVEGNYDLWETLFLKGEFEAALAEADYLNYPVSALAVTHYALGNATKADEYLAELIKNRSAYALARVYGYRGEIDKTFEWLNYLLENSDYYPVFILSETAFRSVFSDPRWELYLEKLGLLEYWLEMPPEWRRQGDIQK